MSRPIILLMFWTPDCMNESKLIFINSKKRGVKLFYVDCSFSKLQSSTRLVSVLQILTVDSILCSRNDYVYFLLTD